MYGDINLAGRQQKKTPKKQLVTRYKIGSFLFLFIVLILSFLFFLLNYRFSVNSIMKKENEVTQSISGYSDIAAKIYLVNSRLANIATILNDRRDFNNSVGKIISSSDSSVSVQAYTTNSRDIITVTVSSTSLLELSDYVNKLVELTSSSNIKSVKMQSLSIDDGGYTMVLVIGLT